MNFLNKILGFWNYMSQLVRQISQIQNGGLNVQKFNKLKLKVIFTVVSREMSPFQLSPQRSQR